jgi:hypothetical protein
LSLPLYFLTTKLSQKNQNAVQASNRLPASDPREHRQRSCVCVALAHAVGATLGSRSELIFSAFACGGLSPLSVRSAMLAAIVRGFKEETRTEEIVLQLLPFRIQRLVGCVEQLVRAWCPGTRPPATRTCGRGQRGTPVQAVRGHAWGFTSTKRRRAAHHATMAGDPSGVPGGRTPAARHRFVLQRLQLASRVHERKPSRTRVAQRRDAAWGSPRAVTLRLRQAHPWVRGVTRNSELSAVDNPKIKHGQHR